MRRKVVIIGAGIGGLAAASALHRFGVEFAVFEQAPEAREVGAGLQLGPNAYRVLCGLGLERQLLEVASEVQAMVTIGWRGDKLLSLVPLGKASREKYGAPYLTASRTDLHRLLLESIPASYISFGMKCVSVVSKADGAVARFADGTEVEADLIVGCDGINSTVRSMVFGAGAARFTEGLYWRGKVPMERVAELGLDTFGPDFRLTDYVSWLGPTGRVMCYPMSSGRYLNIVAGYTMKQWLSDSWSTPSPSSEVFAAYKGWDERMLAILMAVDEWFKWGVFDRDPMPTWMSGAVTLLGDAAHPFIPNLAQGASMAMEDGYVLGQCLAAQGKDLRSGAQLYESHRRPRTERAQLQARAQFRVNLMDPPPPRIDRDWIFSFDATQQAV
jgi:salicylate hydroxylase